jgi:hypothetical protein
MTLSYYSTAKVPYNFQAVVFYKYLIVSIILLYYITAEMSYNYWAGIPYDYNYSYLLYFHMIIRPKCHIIIGPLYFMITL